jgi:hypothetical protein
MPRWGYGRVCAPALRLASRWTMICDGHRTTNSLCALRWAFLSLSTVNFVLQ